MSFTIQISFMVHHSLRYWGGTIIQLYYLWVINLLQAGHMQSIRLTGCKIVLCSTYHMHKTMSDRIAMGRLTTSNLS